MTIEQAIRSVLLGDSDLTDLIGYRLYPQDAPQGAPLPYLIYSQASRQRLRSLTGHVNLDTYQLTLECHAETYADAKAVSEAVRTAILDYTGSVSGIRVLSVAADDEQSEHYPPIAGEEFSSHQIVLSLSIWYSGGA